MIGINTSLTTPSALPQRALKVLPAVADEVAPSPQESFQPGSRPAVVATPLPAEVVEAPVIETRRTPSQKPPALLLAEVESPPEVYAIDRRVPVLLNSVADSLSRHWDFLYSRNDPGRLVPDPGKVWSDRQRETTAKGIHHALDQLREKGHEKGTGKVAILGGGYEVDLGPLLEQFAEVHVIDLSDKPFPVVARQNENDPNRGKLKFIQTDLSGVNAMAQGVEVERLRQERSAGKPLDVEGVKNFMANLGRLEPTALGTGEYTMVVAPVITESMPYGPLITDMEARRETATREAGIDDSHDRRSTWKHASSVLPEDFYFDSRVRDGFDKLFLHQSQEIERILTPGGIGVVSFWTRPDERQSERAPDEKSQLHRLGDNSVTDETFNAFFSRFQHTEVTQTKIYGEDKKPTVHCYTLGKA